MKEDKVVNIIDKRFQEQGFTTRLNDVAFKTVYEEVKGEEEELMGEKVRIRPFIPYRLTKVDIIASDDNDTWIIEAKGDYDKNPRTYTHSFEAAIAALHK